MSVTVTLAPPTPIRIGIDGSEIPVAVQPDVVLVEISGGIGPPGPAAAADYLIVHEFAWGDASPALVHTIPGGHIVFRCTINIETAFNGTGATLSVGIGNNDGVFMGVSQNLPGVVASYETYPGFSYASDTPIYLTIVPGGGASAGKGQLILEIE